MKENRLEKILQIINDNVILTQDDLQNALLSEGFKVTQSTISRDIKRLRLVKGHDADGNYRYISAVKTGDLSKDISRYREMFAKSAISVEYALNDIVIKCYDGMASSACVAVDTVFGGRMLGTIAGDNTIFVITKSVDDAEKLANELKSFLKGTTNA
ncbi:MAG: arginine repressor [Clostridia bacterium]|nr:arginine repressor [Clostridia bacterium]